LRDPIPVYSSPALTELCGRDGPLLDLAEFDPDADLKGAVALYGPVVETMCEWDGCAETVHGGRGTKTRWCATHARRSGGDRKRARFMAAGKRRPPKCAFPGCNEPVGTTRGGTARWCPEHRWVLRSLSKQQRRALLATISKKRQR
jgi:hypothetical protein